MRPIRRSWTVAVREAGRWPHGLFLAPPDRGGTSCCIWPRRLPARPSAGRTATSARSRTSISMNQDGTFATSSWTPASADAPAPLVAAAIDFLLEGLYSQKKISRNDVRGYHGAEARAAVADSSSAAHRDADAGRRRGAGRDAAEEEAVLQLRAQDGLRAQGLRVRHRGANEVQVLESTFPISLDELDMDELMSKLSDLLLSSGFGNPRRYRRRQRSHDAGAARRDPRSAVQRRRAADDSSRSCSAMPPTATRSRRAQQLEELIQQIIERMKESGYIIDAARPRARDGSAARRAAAARANRSR